jgi:hypothetical protein
MARSSYPSQNPFTVDPGNDYSSGLAGLSNTMENVRQARLQEAEQQRRQQQQDRAQQRFEEVQGAAQQAFASQNPDEVAKIAIKYPEITQMLQQATGLKDDMQKREASGFLRKLMTASPENRAAIYQQRIQSVQDRGGDPSHSIQSYKDFLEHPEDEIANTELIWAGADPDGYAAYSSERKAKQKAELEQQKIAAEESRFQRGEAGKNSRAAMNAGDRALTRQIAALTAQQNAEMNQLKRQEIGLKIDEKQQKLEQSKLETQKNTESAIANIDASIESADKLLSHPGLSSAVGISSAFPTIPGSKSADFLAELESYNAKTFMSNVAQMKGLGALTEAEGAKLTAAAGAVKPGMSEKSLRNNLETMKQGMMKAKDRMAKRGVTATPAPAASSDGWEIVN